MMPQIRFLFHRVGLLVFLAFWVYPNALSAKEESIRVPGQVGALMLGKNLSLRPGAWVRYNVKLSGLSLPGNLNQGFWVKLGLPLNLEPSSDGNHRHWFEIEISDPSGRPEHFVAILAEIAGDPRQPHEILRLFIKAGLKVPMEIPKQYLNLNHELEPSCAKAEPQGCLSKGGAVKKLGSKKMYTPKGWIQASRVQVDFPGKKQRADYWSSTEVPLFGLVKAALFLGDRTAVLEMVDFGDGALSRISLEKAVPMPQPEEWLKRLSAFDNQFPSTPGETP